MLAGGLEVAWLTKADAESSAIAQPRRLGRDKLNEALVTMANGGAKSWTAMSTPDDQHLSATDRNSRSRRSTR
jgi:hypothetical protein